jgi:hypothetical protein
MVSVKGKITRGSKNHELGWSFRQRLSILNAAELGVELFGERGLKEIIQDLNESVFMKKIA